MKISILLPYKENFSSENAGAVSLYVKDISVNSRYKGNITIYGDTVNKKKLLKNFIHIDTKNKLYLSKTKAYIEKFIDYQKKDKSDLIEIHNRPTYVKLIKKHLDSRIILYFHNDPLSMKGSTSTEERIFLLSNVEKIIFNSNWCKSRFEKDLETVKFSSKLEVIPQSTSKIKINFDLKKNIISFVGKLNDSKGYDIFGKTILKILDEFKSWRAIVVGDEPRQKHFFFHKRLKIYGFKTNSFILNKLKEVSISVVPSKWDEPFGRSSLEAASRGCALIISNRGGLLETSNHALILKNINEIELFKNIKKLILNNELRKKLQKNNYKNFYLTNNYVTKLTDQLRKKVIINFTNKKNLKFDKLKILHITNLNERFEGRLHYNTGKRINNGFIRLGHNVLTLSDRDILNTSKNLLDPTGTKSLNKKIINTHKNFKADLIVLGHADNINKNTIRELQKINNVKICQWFLDPLIKTGPDYNKNKFRVKSLDKIIDASFLTTHPGAIGFKVKNSFYIPNPCDESFEILDNSKSIKNKDLFFAMSHGVHRGVLKEGKLDGREKFLKKLSNKISNISFDIHGMNNIQPIWGDNFIQNLSKYNMGLNLSRGEPIKYYSSDRIVQLMGNGLLTFIDIRTKLNQIIKSDSAVFYKNIDDLVRKIKFYKNNPNKQKRIASKGKKLYLKRFNSNIVANYMIKKTFNRKFVKKFKWQK